MNKVRALVIVNISLSVMLVVSLLVANGISAQAAASLGICKSRTGNALSVKATCSASETRLTFASLFGATGPKGEIGAKGAQGATGLQGLTGQQGPMGPAGQQGPMGPAGATGLQGPAGSTAIQAEFITLRAPSSNDVYLRSCGDGLTANWNISYEAYFACTYDLAAGEEAFVYSADSFTSTSLTSNGFLNLQVLKGTCSSRAFPLMGDPGDRNMMIKTNVTLNSPWTTGTPVPFKSHDRCLYLSWSLNQHVQVLISKTPSPNQINLLEIRGGVVGNESAVDCGDGKLSGWNERDGFTKCVLDIPMNTSAFVYSADYLTTSSLTSNSWINITIFQGSCASREPFNSALDLDRFMTIKSNVLHANSYTKGIPIPNSSTNRCLVLNSNLNSYPSLMIAE